VSHSGRATVARIIAPCVLTALLLISAGAATAYDPLDDLAGPLKALATGGFQAERALGLGPAAVPMGGAGTVQTVVYFRTPGDAIATDLTRYGGVVQIRRGERVQALLPVDRLLEIAALPQVAQIAPPTLMVPCQGYGSVWSEGVQLTNALALHVVGITGEGCKVAVVDIGFTDYDSHEVPVPAGTPSRTPSFRTDASISASPHGTAVAEVFADMAPDVEMYLVSVDTALSAEEAIDWVISEDFDVAVMSLAVLEGPFNGTHPLSQAVNLARQMGVFWVNAAGNFAERHWMGEFEDSDHDAFHEWSAGDEDMSLLLPSGRFDAYLSWFETAGAYTSQDYDLVLYDTMDNQVARSAYTQNGDDPPREYLVAYTPGGVYNLRIEAMNIDDEQVDSFQLFLPSIDITTTLQVPETSIAIPADAQWSYTVGATRGTMLDQVTPGQVPGIPQIDEIQPYSSRGPVLGGWLKVDLTAPDVVSTSFATGDTAEGVSLNPFMGTSAAAPHVAGAAALLWSEDRNRSANDLAQSLNTMAVDLGDPGPDTVYGHGRLSLRAGTDTDKPVIFVTFPRNGDTIGTPQPQVRALITDASSAIDTETLLLTLDGIEYDLDDDELDYDVESGLMLFETPYELTRTAHQVLIDVSDISGNAADQAVSNFRVALPTVDAGLHMFSLPYTDLADPNPAALFGLPVSDFALVRWVPTDSSYSKYHFYPDPLASFEPPDAGPGGVVETPPAGLAYFLSLPTQVTLNITGSPLPSESYYRINLAYGTAPPRGWNMIGTPFSDPTDWGSVRFITDGSSQNLYDAVMDGVTDGILFELKSAGGAAYYDFAADPFAATMQPYVGYWLHVWRDTTVQLYGGVSAFQAEDEAKAQPAISADNWQLRMVASADNAFDPTNIIGVALNASDGYDPGQDVVEPPAMVNGLQVYFPQRNWGDRAGYYARDIRGAGAAVHTWELEAVCGLSQTPVTLRWPELNAMVPGGVRLMLKDLDAGKEVYMRTATEYTFTTPEGGGTRHLQIVASSAGGETLGLTGVTAAQAPAGGVVISYQLTHPAAVSIEIRNISGVLIKRFAERMAAANTSETVLWNVTSDRGTKAPAGRYLARITARAENGQTIQAIRAFVVLP